MNSLIARFLPISRKLLCPCCQSHVRRFLPFGVTPRPNARCPHCGSLERHRLLRLYLKDRTDLLLSEVRVLHFAPESVLQGLLKSLPKIDYMTADLNSPLAMVRMDIEDIAFMNDSFDLILCVRVLEHVKDDFRAIQELFRILKPKGRAILQSPIDLNLVQTFEDPRITLPQDRERFFGQRDYVRLYGRDYKNRLERAGFLVRVESYAKELGREKIQTYSLMEDEDILSLY
jgi:SAM-dependent methyltransferase